MLFIHYLYFTHSISLPQYNLSSSCHLSSTHFISSPLISHLPFLVSSVSSPLHNLSHRPLSSTVSPLPPHHFPLPCLPSHPVLLSPFRPASSMWLDTGSQCWARPLSCTGASRSRESSTPGRTRRTNTTGFCFAASKRAWKPNTHLPTDDAKISLSWNLSSAEMMGIHFSHLNQILLSLLKTS